MTKSIQSITNKSQNSHQLQVVTTKNNNKYLKDQMIKIKNKRKNKIFNYQIQKKIIIKFNQIQLHLQQSVKRP